MASLLFYGWWKIDYIPIIVFSIFVNYSIGTFIITKQKLKQVLLALGISFNLVLLCYFKYINFLIDTFEVISGCSTNHVDILLPLAISFFTFQQIAYLADCYRDGGAHQKRKNYSFLDYSLFILFFPQLIAGPIVHHKEMMPQFLSKTKFISAQNIYAGIVLFSMGLAKKVLLADYFAVFANNGYNNLHEEITFFGAWFASLSYTLQIYFDFSGYTDMALGSALFFGIKLPLNFDSPYKSRNIQEFWRKWHMTLGRFLRDYIYVPLGGAKNKIFRNIIITFLLGGIWHGASWTFVAWGLFHGLGLVMFHIYRNNFSVNLPKFISILLTLFFINFTWIFFRASNFSQAISFVKAILGLNGIVLPGRVASLVGNIPGVSYGTNWINGIADSPSFILAIFFGFIINLFAKNSNYYASQKPNLYILILSLLCFNYSMLNLNKETVFLYWQF